jgi:Protein of unknown function (DUF1566)
MSRFDRPLAVAVLFLMTVPSAHAAVNDHLKCYKVKDGSKIAGTADLDTPAFGLDPGCKISGAKFFCVSGTKTNVTATDNKVPITLLPVSGPDPGDRICYKVKCAAVPGDQLVADQFGTRTVTKFKASLLCTPAVAGGVPPRFVDNGDGTVTDNQTGLQWEKKDTAVGSGVNLADPHDVDNTYSWDQFINSSGTGFLDGLNNCSSLDGTAVTTAGFAGHCDWRLPTIQELQTIVDLGAVGCGSGSPCIDPVFGPTVTNLYWSATTFAGTTAWTVDFFVGSVDHDGKISHNYVRAVRTGS